MLSINVMQPYTPDMPQTINLLMSFHNPFVQIIVLLLPIKNRLIKNTS